MNYVETLVTEFCKQLATTQRGVRQMHSYYLFSDKRPGPIRERFEQDARDYFEYEKMFQGGVR